MTAFCFSPECRMLWWPRHEEKKAERSKCRWQDPLELLPARDPDQKESNGKSGELHPPTPGLSFWADTGLKHIRHDVAGQWQQTILIKMLCCSTVSVVRGLKALHRHYGMTPHNGSVEQENVTIITTCWPQGTEMLRTKLWIMTPSPGSSFFSVTNSQNEE